MNPSESDTIIAIATPPGKGAIGIARLSGANSFAIAERMMGGNSKQKQISKKPCQQIIISTFYNPAGELLDKGITLLFPAPNSFTGEDVVEFQTHGNPIILQNIVDSAITLGARQATAGEFSRRAYQNGKMDLTQAEAVADLINSDTDVAMRAALKSLQGEFSYQVKRINELLTQLRVYVEAGLDFPDEEIDFLQDKELQQRSAAIIDGLEQLIKQAQQGALLREQKTLAIVGKPNAGKSSLLNLLCRHERAIVSPIAGTTRDFVQEAVNIKGMAIVLTDTAGIRDNADEVEQEGIRRSWEQAGLSDIIILIYDIAESPNVDVDLQGIIKTIASKGLLDRTIMVANKIDVQPAGTHSGGEKQAGEDQVGENQAGENQAGENQSHALSVRLSAKTAEGENQAGENQSHALSVRLSAKTAEGLEALLDSIAQLCGKEGGKEGGTEGGKEGGTEGGTTAFTARRRHIVSLKDALKHITEGYERLKQQKAAELFAEDIKLAQSSLGEIVGQTSSEDLLDRIFADFCIGK